MSTSPQLKKRKIAMESSEDRVQVEERSVDSNFPQSPIANQKDVTLSHEHLLFKPELHNGLDILSVDVEASLPANMSMQKEDESEEHQSIKFERDSHFDESDENDSCPDLNIPASSMDAENTSMDDVIKERERRGIPPFRDSVINIEYYHNDILELTLSFLTSRNTLYDVLNGLFTFYLKNERSGDMLHSHLWSLSFRSKHSNLQFVGDGMHSFSSSDIECNKYSPYPLAKFLDLQVDDRMKFIYDMGSTTTVTMRISSVKLATEEDKSRTYPLLTNRGHTTQLSLGQDDSFLSEEEKSLSLRAREIYESTEELTWSRRQNKYIPLRRPEWSPAEKEALIFLQYAGVKFTRAWNEYLQYCLLTRTKATSSGKWYQEKKMADGCDAFHGESRWLFNGAKYSTNGCLQRALKILRGIRSRAIAASGVRCGGRQEHQDDVTHCPPGPVVDLASTSGDILKIRRR